MGIITLTDRISVSVRAKNETERNSQKRATGKNIANALGNSNISDSLADEIGNTTKPTITDENGNEWISMADIIAAGKKMKENGAFKEKPSYDEYTYGKYKIFHISALTGIARNGSRTIDGTWHSGDSTETLSGDMYISGELTYNESRSTYSLKYSILPDGNDIMYEGSFSGYDGSSDSKTRIQIQAGMTQEGYFNSDMLKYGPSFNEISPMLPFNGQISLTPSIVEAAVRNGGTHHGGGGSLIDWTKPDDEIEEDIRNLHETWDVSEHPGASGQGVGAGTYILAGPIEFNDAD